MPPSKKSLFDTLVGTFVETSEGGSAPPCGSIILIQREAELHNLTPCGSKIRDKRARSLSNRSLSNRKDTVAFRDRFLLFICMDTE